MTSPTSADKINRNCVTTKVKMEQKPKDAATKGDTTNSKKVYVKTKYEGTTKAREDIYIHTYI